MGWISDADGHEGWVANVLADGRASSGSTGGGVLVYEVRDSDRDAGYEIRFDSEVVVPWEQVVTWRVMCSCGWTGSEIPAFADEKYGFRDCPEDLQDNVFWPQWNAHIEPFVALDGLRALVVEARELDESIIEKVRLARSKGASWSEVGSAAGLTKQGAQQRWGDLAS